MARKRSSIVSDMQLSFDLWGLEDSVPDDDALAVAGDEERNLDDRPIHAGPAEGEVGGDRPEPSDGVDRRPVSEADGVVHERPDGGERDRVRGADSGILRTWVLDHESGAQLLSDRQADRVGGVPAPVQTREVGADPVEPVGSGAAGVRGGLGADGRAGVLQRVPDADPVLDVEGAGAVAAEGAGGGRGAGEGVGAGSGSAGAFLADESDAVARAVADAPTV